MLDMTSLETLVQIEKGKLLAQIKNDGKYGPKLPIKKENFRQGIDPIQAANAIQMRALAEQIEQVKEQLIEIDCSVRESLQGQQNDRIGLYYSGLSLFLEARNVTDHEMKKMIITQALHALTESTYQLSLKMQSDIKYLENKDYESSRGKRKSLIDEKMSSINQSFAFIHQACMLRAGIYCDQNEFAAMASVIEQYSAFIENSVKGKSQLLIECDTRDDGSENSVWKRRAEFKIDISDIAKRLNSTDKTVYLKIGEENI